MNTQAIARLIVALLVPVALATACASSARDTGTTPAIDGTDPGPPGSGDDAGQPAKTPDAPDAPEQPPTDTPDPADGKDAGKTDAGGPSGSGSCGALSPCDPLRDTGCPSGQHCMVTYASSSKSEVKCQAAGTSPPEEYLDGAGCDANPCQPGYACYGGVFCQKLCDPNVTGSPLPASWIGQGNSPSCGASKAGWNDCVVGPKSPPGPAKCYGHCTQII